jgi:hypothetical protein
LEVSYEKSKEITDKIGYGDLSQKPGWVRMSLHPATTNNELICFTNAIREIIQNYKEWGKEYFYDKRENEFQNHEELERVKKEVLEWFE